MNITPYKVGLAVIISALTCIIFITSVLFFVQKSSDNKGERPGSSTSDNGAASAKNTTPANWPIFRADTALTGSTSGNLADSLSLLWKYKTDGPISSSAVVYSGRVFVGSDDGYIHAVKLKNGHKVWKYKTEDAVQAPVCVVDDMVLVGSLDCYLYCLDRQTGELKWKFKTGDKIPGSVNWYRPSPKGSARILVGSYDNYLYCLDAADGRVIWKYESEYYINGAPAVFTSSSANVNHPGDISGQVVFGGCDAHIHILSLNNGKKIHTIDADAYIAGSPALAEGRFYVGNFEDTFFCGDLSTGQIIWRHKTESEAFYASPAVNAEKIVAATRDKHLYCFDRADGKTLWTFNASSGFDSSPVICSDNVIAASDDGWLYLVSLAQGKEIWSFEIGAALSASPALASGRILIGAEDGYLYCFGEK